jgi:hypothetical protein
VIAAFLEATGGFQRSVVAALPVVVVHPRHARGLAKATGQLAKTDGLDAQALAQFAEAVRLTPRPLPDVQTDALRALLARRRQLVAIRTAESNRLGGVPPRVQEALQAPIAWLDQRLVAIDEDLDTTLCASPVWCERKTLYRSVPGMEPVCARTLVLDLPARTRSPANSLSWFGKRSDHNAISRSRGLPTHSIAHGRRTFSTVSGTWRSKRRRRCGPKSCGNSTDNAPSADMGARARSTSNCITGMATTRRTNRPIWSSSIPTVTVRDTIHQTAPLPRRVPRGALVMLERSAGKLARCVLRGLGRSDPASYPAAALFTLGRHHMSWTFPFKRLIKNSIQELGEQEWLTCRVVLIVSLSCCCPRLY